MHCQDATAMRREFKPVSSSRWTFTSAMTTSIPSWAMARAVPLPDPTCTTRDDGDLAFELHARVPLLRRICPHTGTLQWTMIFLV